MTVVQLQYFPRSQTEAYRGAIAAGGLLLSYLWGGAAHRARVLRFDREAADEARVVCPGWLYDVRDRYVALTVRGRPVVFVFPSGGRGGWAFAHPELFPYGRYGRVFHGGPP